AVEEGQGGIQIYRVFCGRCGWTAPQPRSVEEIWWQYQAAPLVASYQSLTLKSRWFVVRKRKSWRPYERFTLKSPRISSKFTDCNERYGTWRQRPQSAMRRNVQAYRRGPGDTRADRDQAEPTGNGHRQQQRPGAV